MTQKSSEEKKDSQVFLHALKVVSMNMSIQHVKSAYAARPHEICMRMKAAAATSAQVCLKNRETHPQPTISLYKCMFAHWNSMFVLLPNTLAHESVCGRRSTRAHHSTRVPLNFLFLFPFDIDGWFAYDPWKTDSEDFGSYDDETISWRIINLKIFFMKNWITKWNRTFARSQCSILSHTCVEQS